MPARINKMVMCFLGGYAKRQAGGWRRKDEVKEKIERKGVKKRTGDGKGFLLRKTPFQNGRVIVNLNG